MFWPPLHGCVGEFLEFVFTHISQRIVGATNKQHMAVILCYKVIVFCSFSHLFPPCHLRADAKYGLSGIGCRIGFVFRPTRFPNHLPSFAAEPSHEECLYFRQVVCVCGGGVPLLATKAQKHQRVMGTSFIVHSSSLSILAKIGRNCCLLHFPKLYTIEC